MEQRNVIITGIQGAGKGTQSEILRDKYGFKHISTGNMFRIQYACGSSLGIEAHKYWSIGALVPDSITISLLKRHLSTDKNLLDGFPRTLPQAQALDDMLLETDRFITQVIALELSDESALQRIEIRQTCIHCGTVYGSAKQPALPNFCDICTAPLITRADDTTEKARTRIATYHSQTKPLIQLYSARDIVHHIDASLPPEQVAAHIVRALKL